MVIDDYEPHLVPSGTDPWNYGPRLFGWALGHDLGGRRRRLPVAESGGRGDNWVVGELVRVALGVVVAGALLAVGAYGVMALLIVAKALVGPRSDDPVQDELDAFLVELLGPRDVAVPSTPRARERAGFSLVHRRRHGAVGRQEGLGRAA
jgi:hypothetical protein